MDIDLLSMPEGALYAWDCDLSMFPDPGNPDHKCKSKMVSLFEKKRMKGFWPFYNEKSGERKLKVSSNEILYVKTVGGAKYWQIKDWQMDLP